MKNKLMTAGAVLAALFVVSTMFKPYESGLATVASFLLKASPIWCLAAAAWLFGPQDNRGKLLFAGVAFGSIGDIWLDLNPAVSWFGIDGKLYFVFGLGAFLIGHLFYIGFFMTKFQLNKKNAPLAALLAAFALGMAVILYPAIMSKEPPLLVPVFVYVGVIATMAVAALLRAGIDRFAILGALTFMVSDSLIAVNKFLAQMENPETQKIIFGLSIIITYYLAQFFIVEGAIRTKE